MSSTSQPPPLTARERHVLETMVHHECRHDPAFVDRLTGWSGPAPAEERASRRRPEPATVVAVVGVLVTLGVLVGLAAHGLVALAAAGVVLMLVVPVALVVAVSRRPRH